MVVAALTQEPHSAAARAWLAAQAEADLAASQWTLLEVGSALSIKARSGALTTDQQQWAMHTLGTLAAAHWQMITPMAGDFADALHWASQPELRLRGGDALHIAMVHHRAWVLATLDKGMAAAALRLTVPVAPLP